MDGQPPVNPCMHRKPLIGNVKTLPIWAPAIANPIKVLRSSGGTQYGHKLLNEGQTTPFGQSNTIVNSTREKKYIDLKVHGRFRPKVDMQLEPCS
jgi:hypothetical protein